MELGKKIKQLRYKSSLTQEQLAERLGISAQSVSKWENAVAMPDISTLPLLAEVFGVTIDDLFDLSSEQRLNRIENRLDAEDNLPQDVFLEYEAFLQNELKVEAHKQRATDLLAYLYWHLMESFGRKASRYAKEGIRMNPGVKCSQWLLCKTDGHTVWDWNMGNHSDAIDFYREIVEANPTVRSPYLFLIDNLLADHRADEAERYLAKLRSLPDARPVMIEIYRAHIALARFDEQTADRIIEELLAANPEDHVCLFEAAQYYAAKCEYDKAMDCYERDFACDTSRPRYQDALMGIADIHKIRGEYEQAAKTYERILKLLQDEWGMSDEDEIKTVRQKIAALREKAKR